MVGMADFFPCPRARRKESRAASYSYIRGSDISATTSVAHGGTGEQKWEGGRREGGKGQRAAVSNARRCNRVQVGHAMQFCGNWVSEFSG